VIATSLAADWAAFILTVVGAGCAITAAILGLRMKPRDYQLIEETGRSVFGSEKIIAAIRMTSWWLLFGGLAALAAAGIQARNLIS
jgi:hypothetical protein